MSSKRTHFSPTNAKETPVSVFLYFNGNKRIREETCFCFLFAPQFIRPPDIGCYLGLGAQVTVVDGELGRRWQIPPPPPFHNSGLNQPAEGEKKDSRNEVKSE